jgi:uncharacterized protein
MVVGVISDTHGLLRPEALATLRGSELILHAGDIGAPEILTELRRLAPVHAVRGNVDVQPWAASLPAIEVVEAGGSLLYMLHNLKELDLKPRAAGFAAVVSGHSHVPGHKVRDGVLYFNPGSAGPRRFRLPVSVGRLTITNGRITPEIIKLG